MPTAEKMLYESECPYSKVKNYLQNIEIIDEGRAFKDACLHIKNTHYWLLSGMAGTPTKDRINLIHVL
ncbi:MAG: hypothetical protein KBB37_03645 [Bacteroidia bacterium]|nr:hypothetical protein [Bacteroidia bacterium]MBP7260358.1 hypothetical protein [Bacteroidia bacterium]MBP9180149.1 hypothetical protein [Bacteroidia bacterium]MBP9725249.1 hypothetical protein [Bacteroidia bacterium]